MSLIPYKNTLLRIHEIVSKNVKIFDRFAPNNIKRMFINVFISLVNKAKE